MVTFLERLGCEVEKAAAEVVVREVERPPRLGDELGDQPATSWARWPPS
jgi:hypothetical protein